MGRIIASTEELITPAHDKFMDGHPTRRELQQVFNKIGSNQAELFGMVDTQALVGNFLCEKLGVTRAEIEAYVQKKAQELKELQEKATGADPMTVAGDDMGRGTGTSPDDTPNLPMSASEGV
jgi:hypothetical protein